MQSSPSCSSPDCSRIEHALPHHADVGSEFREVVTDRAERIESWLTVALVGWLLLAACAPVSSCRRGRWAVRRLEDPLPRP